jgi:hypothetical protein
MSSSFLLVPARFVLIILFNYILSQGFFFQYHVQGIRLTNLNFSLDWNVLKAISPLKIGRGALLLSLKMEITLRLRLALCRIFFFFIYSVFS